MHAVPYFLQVGDFAPDGTELVHNVMDTNRLLEGTVTLAYSSANGYLRLFDSRAETHDYPTTLTCCRDPDRRYLRQ